MNNISYFDFHCHLDSEQLNGKREEILHEMKERHFGCTTIGVDLQSSRRAVAIATSCENVYSSVGQHPLDNKEEIFKAGEYQRLIDEHQDQVVCVGECGLDYYWPVKDMQAGKMTTDDFEQEKKRQRVLFQQNIMLALANDLPLMLHVRSSEGNEDAHRDTLAILSEYPEIRAVFHFYTNGPVLAQEIVTAGYYISLPGVITFADLDETVRTVPLERMFAETDSPYAAPKPYRGRTNNPLYVEEVYKKIAEIKQTDLETVRKQILQNTQQFLVIPGHRMSG